MSTITTVATGAPRERPIEEWLADQARPAESFGTVGEGDDQPAIQAVLNAGYSWRPLPGKSYRLKRALQYTTARRGIVGDGSSTIIMDTSANGFCNASSSASYRYGTNAVGIIATNITRPILRGVEIKYENQIDDRFVKAVAFRGCSDIDVQDVEAWNFTKSLGVFYFGNCQRGRIAENYIHDCTTNSTLFGQISGMEFDNDDAGSSDIDVFRNRVERLTVGSVFLASCGYQTDGFNVARNTASRIRFRHNIVRNVGEGFDVFGQKLTLHDNDVQDAYYYGIKLIHGASDCSVKLNRASRCGLAGIGLFGTDAMTLNTARNKIMHNQISEIDPNGTFSGSATAGIVLAANGGTTYLPRDNHINDNHIETPGKYGLLAPLGSGSGNYALRNFISGATEYPTLVHASVVPYFAPYV